MNNKWKFKDYTVQLMKLDEQKMRKLQWFDIFVQNVKEWDGENYCGEITKGEAKNSQTSEVMLDLENINGQV